MQCCTGNRSICYLANLHVALLWRSSITGSLSDLEDAISLSREVLDLRPPPNRERPESLHNLAFGLHKCFSFTGNVVDLNDAIVLYQEALHLRPSPHPSRADSLFNLAVALQERLSHTGSLHDLDVLMATFQEALAQPLTPRDRIMSLCGLAETLIVRFERDESVDDLEQVGSVLKEALDVPGEKTLEVKMLLGKKKEYFVVMNNGRFLLPDLALRKLTVYSAYLAEPGSRFLNKDDSKPDCLYECGQVALAVHGEIDSMVMKGLCMHLIQLTIS